MSVRIAGLTAAEQKEHDEFMHGLRNIERVFDAARADAELEAVRTVRLWSLAAFAALMAGAMLFGGSSAPTLDQALRSMALLAGSAAAFHVATWAMLRAWLWWQHDRPRSKLLSDG